MHYALSAYGARCQARAVLCGCRVGVGRGGVCVPEQSSRRFCANAGRVNRPATTADDQRGAPTMLEEAPEIECTFPWSSRPDNRVTAGVRVEPQRPRRPVSQNCTPHNVSRAPGPAGAMALPQIRRMGPQSLPIPTSKKDQGGAGRPKSDFGPRSYISFDSCTTTALYSPRKKSLKKKIFSGGGRYR